MDLEIRAIDLCGKAFLYDWNSGKVYRMENAGSEILPINEKDSCQMDMSSPLIHPILYAGITFKKITDAQKFISKTTYEYRIKELSAEWQSESDKNIKDRIEENIDIYLEKIKKLN